MALWRIDAHRGQDLVTVTLSGGAEAAPLECGRGELTRLSELQGWAVGQAEPWDRVQLDGKVYVRQARPPGRS